MPQWTTIRLDPGNYRVTETLDLSGAGLIIGIDADGQRFIRNARAGETIVTFDSRAKVAGDKDGFAIEGGR